MTKPRSGRRPLIPASDIAALLAKRAEELCRHLLPEGYRKDSEWRCGSVQGEAGKSLGVHLKGARVGVWKDFATGQSGDPLDLIEAVLNLGTAEAIGWAKNWLGIDDGPTPRPRPAPKSERHDDDTAKRTEAALAIWRASRPAEYTPAEDYLRGRGYTGSIPPTLHYHPALLHPDTSIHLPAMVAAVASVERKVTGIQRIFLTMDGRKAPLTRPKVALGTLRGGAVRLAPTTDRVWLTEGVEDALAVMQMMQEPAWAVLGTSGFKTVELPENIKQVILAPDGDDAGQAVIQEAARRLAEQGREVRTAKLPPEKDWVDLLDDYEERAGILEFDLEEVRPEAETTARREVIHG